MLTSRPRPDLRAPGGEHGQASLEYVVVVAIVVLVLAITGTTALAPPFVNSVGTAFQRALCRVTGEGCATVDTKPCIVRSAGTDVSAGARVTFLKIGRTTALLRSVGSDGSVTLTLLDHVDAGLTASVGASGRLQLAGVDVATGAVAQVGAVARLGGGRTWKVEDARAADELQRRLVEVAVGHTGSSLPVVGPVLGAAQSLLDVGSGRELPPAASTTAKGGLSVSASIDGPFATTLGASASAAVGVRRDRRSGDTTVVLELGAGASAELAAAVAGVHLGGKLGVHVTVDRGGRPTELELTGEAVAGIALAGGTGRMAGGGSRARTGELTATLDLTVPAHRDAARRLLAALDPRRVRELPGAAHALGRAFSTGGRIEIARYASEEEHYGAGAEVSLGPGVGGELDVTQTQGRLLDAWTRPAGGLWERRADCLETV